MTGEAVEEVALSRDQQARWRESVVQWPQPVANLSATYELEGAVDPQVLSDAFARVVARHEQLRLRIVESAGSPRGTIRPPSPDLRLPQIDLRGLDASARERFRALYGAREAAVPFDLARDLPVRAQLLTVSDWRHDLLLSVSHVAADGWSLGILARDLAAWYRALAAGDASRTPVPAPFSEYVDEDERRYESGEHVRHLPWWRERLRDAPRELGLGGRGGAPSAEALFHRFRIEDAPGRAMRKLARSMRVSLFVLGRALLGVQLRRRTGRTDLVVATPFVGRRFPRFADTVGLFVTRLLVRLDLRGASSFADLVGRVHATVLDAVDHAGTPRDVLGADLRSRGEDVTAQVVFQTFPPELCEDPDAVDPAARLADFRTAALPFVLALHVSEGGDAGLLGWYGHLTSALTASEGCSYVEELRELLDALVRDPERPLAPFFGPSAA
jgi:hypothetical protein